MISKIEVTYDSLKADKKEHQNEQSEILNCLRKYRLSVEAQLDNAINKLEIIKQEQASEYKRAEDIMSSSLLHKKDGMARIETLLQKAEDLSETLGN